MIQSLFGFLSSHFAIAFRLANVNRRHSFHGRFFGESCYGSRPARKKLNLATSVGSPGQCSCPSFRGACRHPVVLPQAACRPAKSRQNSEGLAALRPGSGCAYQSVTGPPSYFVSTCRRLFFLRFFRFAAGHPEGRVRSHCQQSPDPEDRTLG